jgi:hypothetical protein
MEVEARPRLTREQALALLQRDRWAAVNALVEAEARRATPEERFRDLDALVATGTFFARGLAVAERPPEALTPALAAVLSWLRSREVPFAVVGGVAVGLLGRPRYTKDIDVLVALEEPRIVEALASAREYALQPRVPDVAVVALRTRVVLLRHAPTNMPVDVMLASVPIDFELLDRTRVHEQGGLSIPLPRVQDLITMKVLAHRHLDLGDVDTLLAMNPTEDLADALRIVREVAESACMPDLLAQFERLVRVRRGGRL